MTQRRSEVAADQSRSGFILRPRQRRPSQSLAGTSLALVAWRAMHSKSAKTKRLCVTVVSSNHETLQGLETYLGDAGVIVSSTRAIEGILEMTHPSAAAVILFPDEYRLVEVRTAVRTLTRERPEVLLVIVTNDPLRFEEARTGQSDHTAPLVIPKPAWAWTILDAVRGRLNSDAAIRTASN